MIGAGRLEDDAGDGMIGEPATKRIDATGVVGELASAARRVKMHVERRFGDVDTDILGYDGFHLFRSSACHAGQGPRIRSGHRKREGRSVSSSARHGLCFSDPSLPAAGKCTARRQRPFFAERPTPS